MSMAAHYPEIAARMFNTPLMLHEGKGNVIARAFGPRVLGTPDLDVQAAGVSMGIVGDEMGQWRESGDRCYEPRRHGRIAVIEIEGSLINKGKWIGKSSGQTTYEGIITQVNAVIDDSSVEGVILEIDSFGGEVTGAFDCAERLYELSQAKPTIAILTDHALSAGYLLAATARQIVIPQNGQAGSIGVISMHVDASKWLADQGLSVTILKAGARKADFNAYQPLPPEVLEEALTDMEAMRRDFAATVARFRAGRLSFDAAMATEAKCFRGEAAVEAGLADAVARPSQVLAAFEEELGRVAG
ncbi:S49 family peptidase [Nitratireductor aquimarinus]|uniref:S49 family peptidase n=1 Tax=Nitratireductor aquimarinus TaxID=889300 RepID=A0ABU4AJ77_9HYPH|nr:S49 family peptidase [Nitratireductor aquimarinus]MDV6226297.1 S49 family peptidase [Nitratireductor aquimarinus]